MKVIGLAGSNSKQSINRQLVHYVLQKLENAETELLDLNDFEAPLYSPEREDAHGVPAVIIELAKKISATDLFVLSLAEHNGSYSAAFKNTYDWLSRIPNRKVFDGTNLFLMASSTGGRGGQSVLEAAQSRFPRDGANLLATFSLPNFSENFIDGKLSGEFEGALIIMLKEKVLPA